MPARHAEQLGPASRRAGWILLLVLIGSLATNHALIHPSRNYLLDFRAYYAAGKALLSGVNPYDVTAVREHVDLPGEQTIVRYFYPPPTLALMAGFALLPYPAAQVPWCLLQLALLLGSLWIVLRTVHCPLGSPVSVLIAFAFLTSTAVAELFRWGQFDIVLLALLAAATWALLRSRSGLGGALVGLAAVAKVTPVLYLAVFALRKDFKALTAAVATIALLMGGSAIVLGGPIMRQWAISLGGFANELSTLASPQNMSLQGYIYRGLMDLPGAAHSHAPWLNLGPQVARWCALSASILVVLLTGWWLVRHRRTVSTAESLAWAIPAVLLAAPATWTHHTVQLLIPLAWIITAVLRHQRVRKLESAWLVLALLLFANWPVERFGLELPSWLALLAGPTAMYATGLIWLLMLLRYVPLRQASNAAAGREDSRAIGGESPCQESRRRNPLVSHNRSMAEL